MSEIVDNFDKLFENINESNEIDIIKMFYDKKNINMKTEIPRKSIMALCAIESVNKVLKKVEFKNDGKTEKLVLVTLAVDQIIGEFKEVMVSCEREGRREGKDFLGAIREKLKQNSIFARLMGVDNNANQ